ncbi:MAG: ARMT1-like domain-containing protein, partial [Spirochaetales bacterium]|nr:ARMT1-like domain-containing protein [Spirochaetales bacterium]
VMEHQGFGIYHFETWEEKLASAKQLLYLCDNTGEIVLDRILVETIRETHPDIEIICAFRESPIINDALVTDGIAVGLDRTAELISSGSVYPGTVLPECTGKFKALFDKADMVISKGQGNFETLLGCPKEDLFFILKIKCPLMADLSGASEGDLVLMKNRKG